MFRFLSREHAIRSRLGPFDSPAVYAYAIYARNNLGGGAWSTAGTFQVVSCSRPTIDSVYTSATPIYTIGCQPDRFIVDAETSSAQGVSGAWIGYRPAGAGLQESQWQFAAMSLAQPGWYEGQVGPFAQAGMLEYVVGARSTVGGWSWTEPAQGKVIACQRPTIEKVTSSERRIYTSPCKPNTTVISAKVSDPLGIADVTLRYRDRTEEQWTYCPCRKVLRSGTTR